MIPGFEEEMMGASKGEREFTLEPERAFTSQDDAVLEIPRSNFRPTRRDERDAT